MGHFPRPGPSIEIKCDKYNRFEIVWQISERLSGFLLNRGASRKWMVPKKTQSPKYRRSLFSQTCTFPMSSGSRWAVTPITAFCSPSTAFTIQVFFTLFSMPSFGRYGPIIHAIAQVVINIHVIRGSALAVLYCSLPKGIWLTQAGLLSACRSNQGTHHSGSKKGGNILSLLSATS